MVQGREKLAKLGGKYRLKPKASLTIIECQKKETPFGPPLSMRLSPEEIESVALRCGFTRKNHFDLEFFYLIKFTKA